ncbi:MAG: hypothetical protein RR858_02950 [Mucinivorans sp.]
MIDKIASRFFVSYVGVVVAVGRVASFDWSRGDTEIAVYKQYHHQQHDQCNAYFRCLAARNQLLS